MATACPDRVLWVRYEDMLSDPMREVRRVARLVSPGLEGDDEALRHIVEASSFEERKQRHEADPHPHPHPYPRPDPHQEMKQRHEADPHNAAHRTPGEHAHFRRGKAGDWRAHLTEAQRLRFEAILSDRLKGTGLEEAFREDVPK